MHCNEWKSKFKPRKYESDLPRTQDGRIVEQLVEILKNPDIVKSLLVPKDMGLLFDIVDQAIPGAKELKNPIEETMHHIIPILKVSKSLVAYCQTKSNKKHQNNLLVCLGTSGCTRETKPNIA